MQDAAEAPDQTPDRTAGSGRPRGGSRDDAPDGDPSGPGRLLAELDRRVAAPHRPLARAFARAMLRRVPPDQLAGADSEVLAGEIAEALRFFAERSPEELAIRAKNAAVAIDGWSDPGTVVEIATEDRPFLLTTITEELRRLGHDVVRSLHPILGVERDTDGGLRSILPARRAERRESLIHVELADRIPPEQHDDLVACVREVLGDAMAATRDFPAMRRRLEQIASSLRARVATGELGDDGAEVAALLDWLLDDNFVLLGCRDYEILRPHGRDEPHVRVVRGSGLGILAREEASRYAQPVPLSEADESFRERHTADRLLTIARSHRYSTVRKRARMLNVWVKETDGRGEVVAQFRLLGMFARKAHAVASASIPVLRRKLQRILELEDVVEQSHDERTFVSLFQALPKDELFELDVDELRRTLLGLFAAEEQHAVRVLARSDALTGNVSVIVSVPRDRYDAGLRERIQRLLLDRYGGSSVDVDLSLGDRPEAVARFSLHLPGDAAPEVASDDLETEIRALARTWADDLLSELVALHGEAEGRRIAHTFGHRMPATYRGHTSVAEAVGDVGAFDELARSGRELLVRLHADQRSTAPLTRLKVFKKGTGIELSRILPILESLGLTVTEELPFRLTGEGEELHLHDYGVHDDGELIDVERDGDRLAEALLAGWGGRLEVDSLNRVVLRAGLDWRAATLLRAYRRFRRQVGTAYTADYQNDALVDNPDVTAALVELFDARFDPARRDDEDGGSAVEVAITAARQRVLEACDAVVRLDHDRILRGFLALIDATQRTNRYLDPSPSTVALKLDSTRVPRTPKPVPFREIFVYAPDVEGIHLRGGPVARGGIRWSDRRDDLRTEVLGLMQAQMLKNAVIVPTGAKGGFVLKRPPAGAGRVRAEVERCYRRFIEAILQLTDNVEGDRIVPPDDVVRTDGDDPYLVVAADRGTATFSDIANGIAAEHGFWLGDAFASGGSRGYDHKGLGITARGAWVAVRRHFRELGIDVQNEPVTVVGIGDMSGDVFGNAMLRSRAIRLVAAFDHRDIFLDPAPDPERAFAERARLFADPGLTWQDYDRDAIGPGGGVWSRDEKSIPLSEDVRRSLRIDAEELAPPDLVRAVLSAPVDLLFAGGIGTFVKAVHETHDDIGDRANDEVRIDATDLRARVIGEGANLAITQPARIQYARRGGRLNADFIDNAAGVDISDHEVNLKILLRLAIEVGEIDAGERDRLLAEVTDDVVAACIRDVEEQTWVLSQEAAASPDAIEAYEALMVHLEGRGVLDREVEALPSTEQMDERREAGAGLTRPELAVLLAATKRDLSGDLTASDLPDQEAMRSALQAYFPALLRRRFDHLLDRHRLRGELIATVVSNDVVNRMGVTFVHRLARELGAERSAVVAAWWLAREVARAARYWDAVRGLDAAGQQEVAHAVKRDVDRLLETLVREYLRSADLTDLETTIDRDRDALRELEQVLIGGEARDRTLAGHLGVDDLVACGADPETAAELVILPSLAIAPDVASVGRAVGRPVQDVARAFLALDDALGLERLRRILDGLTPEDRWERWQHRGLVDDLRAIHRVAAHRAISEHRSDDEHDAVSRFVNLRRDAIAHATRLARQIEEEQPAPRLDALSVVVRATRDALRSGERSP